MTLKKAIAKVQSLIVWVRERPQMDAATVGELDAALHYLHMVWAMLTDREKELSTAVENSFWRKNALKTYFKEDERGDQVDATRNSTKKVLRFWSKVDKQLKVEALCDKWLD